MTRYSAIQTDAGFENYKPLATEFYHGELEVQLNGVAVDKGIMWFDTDTGEIEVYEKDAQGFAELDGKGGYKTEVLKGEVTIAIKILVQV